MEPEVRTAEEISPYPNRRPLLALLGANAISMTGNVMALVAIPWFVLQTTGSAGLTGLAAFFNFLPTVLAGFFGGTLVDRLGYKRMSIVADLTSGVTVALIPLLHSTIGLEFWQLASLIFLGALLDAPGTTARAALLPDVARDAGWSLERASGAIQAVERGSRLAGSPVAGLLIAIIGPTKVLWANSATFFASAWLIWAMVPSKRKVYERGSKYWSELKEGLDFLIGDRLLRTIIFTVTLTNLIDAIGLVLLPVYANEIYNSPVSLGLMLGAMGGGSVVGALLFSGFGERLSRRSVLGWGFIGCICWYPVFAVFPPLGIAIAVKAIAGLAAGPINPVIDTIEFERVPENMRGRVFGVIWAVAWMAIPLGVLIGGYLIEAIGIRPTLLVGGAGYLIAGAFLLLSPALREADVREASPANVSGEQGRKSRT